MTTIRRAEVLSVEGGSGRMRLRISDGPLAGEEHPGILYTEFGSPPKIGEFVAANTVGIEMRLGTGGAAFVLPNEGGEVPENDDHFVKLPYTPLQFPTKPKKDVRAETLDGVPVVVLPLHSHLPVACAAAAKFRPGCRTAFVWREGGALPVSFSRTVSELRAEDLLHFVVSSGNCFGGDVEAVNEYSALLATADEADIVLVGIGPGIAGTNSPFGHGGMTAASSLNAAASLGAKPVLAPRISFADPRERHRGISHHTRSVLEAALPPCRVAVPAPAHENLSLDGLPERHEYTPVEIGAAGWEAEFGLTFESMGRRYRDDEIFFDAAAAAVYLALGGEADGGGSG